MRKQYTTEEKRFCAQRLYWANGRTISFMYIDKLFKTESEATALKNDVVRGLVPNPF